MANEERLKLLKEQGVEAWNRWRKEHDDDIDLAYADLGGANLEDANLGGANLWVANFRGANLKDANLTRADLTRANLTRANFRSANLKEANLTLADLTHANLTRANLTRANLTRANLTRANLTHANLQDANLQDAYLQDADFHNANLQDADFHNAKLTRADLHYADLTGADFTNATVNPQTTDLDGLTDEQRDTLNFVDEGFEPPFDRVELVPDRIVTVSAPAGRSAMLTSVYFRHPHNLSNLRIESDLLIEALDIHDARVLAGDPSPDDIRSFLRANIARAARNAGFDKEEVERIVHDAVMHLENTVAGIVTNPLNNLDLEALSKVGVVGVAGVLGVETGDPFFVWFCFAGAIVIIGLSAAVTERMQQRIKQGQLDPGRLITVARKAYSKAIGAWEQRKKGDDDA